MSSIFENEPAKEKHSVESPEYSTVLYTGPVDTEAYVRIAIETVYQCWSRGNNSAHPCGSYLVPGELLNASTQVRLTLITQ